jgi:hypothetical protein
MRKRKPVIAGLVALLAIGTILLWRSMAGTEEIVVVSRMQLTERVDSAGNRTMLPAHFRFSNLRTRLGRALSMCSIRYIPNWQFTVLTNNGNGIFGPAFEPDVLNFALSKDNTHFEFGIRESRLVDSEWKMRIDLLGQYQLPPMFGSRWVKMGLKSWESESLPSVMNTNGIKSQ